MGFMDKAKEAALQAQQKAQQLAQQGQAKVADVQQHRTEAELYRTLGEAFYTEQRRGGEEASDFGDLFFGELAFEPAIRRASRFVRDELPGLERKFERLRHLGTPAFERLDLRRFVKCMLYLDHVEAFRVLVLFRPAVPAGPDLDL